jgi:hypothetical protein
VTPKQAQIAARTARIQQLAAALNISTDGATELLLSRRPVTDLPGRSAEQVRAALAGARREIEGRPALDASPRTRNR